MYRDEEAKKTWEAADFEVKEADEERITCVKLLARFTHAAGNADATDILAEALQEADSNVRQKAIELLGSLGSQRAVEVLLKALQDEDKTVSRRAMSVLAGIDHPRAAESIESLILGLTKELHSGNYEVRLNTLVTLSYIGNRQALDVLLEGFRDEDITICRAAIHLALSLGDKMQTREPVITGLAKMLHNTGNQIRLEAIEALGNIGDQQAVEALLAGLDGGDWEIRKSIIWWVHSLRNKLQIVGPLIAHLARMLYDEDKNVRYAAVKALGALAIEAKGFREYPRAAELLIQALNDKDQSVIQEAADIIHRYCPEWKPSKETRRVLWTAGVTWWPRWYQRLGTWFRSRAKSIFDSNATSYSGSSPDYHRHVH